MLLSYYYFKLVEQELKSSLQKYYESSIILLQKLQSSCCHCVLEFAKTHRYLADFLTASILRRDLQRVALDSLPLDETRYFAGNSECKKGCYPGQELKFGQKCFAECAEGFESQVTSQNEHEYQCGNKGELEPAAQCVPKVARWQFYVLTAVSTATLSFIQLMYSLHTGLRNQSG